MSYIQFQQKCNDCGFSWNTTFGIVGTTCIGQPPEKCPNCSSINILKCADGWTNAELSTDWKSRAEKAEAENAKLQDKLMNLLAVIHRDGGHYVSRHGLDRACKDAEAVSVYRVARVEELEGRIAEYLRELPKVTACFDLERDHFRERIATLEARKTCRSVEHIDLEPNDHVNVLKQQSAEGMPGPSVKIPMPDRAKQEPKP